MNSNTLKALLLIAGKKDVRYYLNGILIDHVKRVAVATNGAMLMVIKLAADDEVNASAIIPRELAEKAVKIGDGTLSISVDGMIKLGGLSAKGVDGRYPDWLRVVPETTSGVAGHYNHELTNTIQKAAALVLGTKNYVIHLNQNGDGAAMVAIGDEGLAVVMPMRENAVNNFSGRAVQLQAMQAVIRK